MPDDVGGSVAVRWRILARRCMHSPGRAFRHRPSRVCRRNTREIHRLRPGALNGAVPGAGVADGQESLPFGAPCRLWRISAVHGRSL